MKLDPRTPTGPIGQQWTKAKFDFKLVNPANKRKHTIIVVGSGLAGASAAATLGELGYNVKCFCFQDSPRRAHSIAAQGGINAAKNYQNDGDSVYRLFYDTVKGGDFRAREANVYRLAEISVSIIDQCVAQGVPFAREYGGALTNRSFGGAQVSRTFYARGQTGQQLLLGAYQATGGAVLRSWAKANPDILVKYLQAYVEGLRWSLDPRNKNEATRLFTDNLKLPGEIAAATYAVAADPADGLAKDAAFDLEGFKNVLKLRADWTGAAPGAPEKYLDLSYYDRALKLVNAQ